MENFRDAKYPDGNDIKHWYNPNKGQNHIGNYAKKDTKKGEVQK
jgi:hypothetical protein